MLRYFRVYKKLLLLNYSALFAYRVNFINSMISSVVWGGMSIGLMSILAYGSSSVYGWKYNELLLMIAVYNIIVGVFHTLFSRNFERFSAIVDNGELDSLLIKPLDAQYLVSFWFINYTSLFRIILGTIFSFYLIQQMHITITFMSILLFLTLMIFSITFLYAIWFTIITLTIWFTNLSNLVGFLYEVNGTTRFPAEMFKELGGIALIFVPLAFAINTPTEIILQKYTSYEVLIVFMCAISLLLFCRWFWKFALRHYSSAGG